jgi:Protein of unknown function (DUF3050)
MLRRFSLLNSAAQEANVDNKVVNLPIAVSPSIKDIEQRIAPLQEQLANHPLYGSIRTLAHLRVFMESHVFAVWDFMSLLKSLQRALTSVEVPWVPTEHRASRRFINEIVLGEESDEYESRPVSHFEIYLDAMARAGANVVAIEAVVAAARGCNRDDLSPLDQALESAPPAARDFVRTTFRMIREGSVAARAAAFTFGREDAIPDMFRALVRDLNREMEGDLNQFVWYLQRHIEVDGDDHGPLSMRMIADLCATNINSWEQAGKAAEDAIRARLALWDGILSQINEAE